MIHFLLNAGHSKYVDESYRYITHLQTFTSRTLI